MKTQTHYKLLIGLLSFMVATFLVLTAIDYRICNYKKLPTFNPIINHSEITIKTLKL